jgi:hypothetical protein
MQSPKDILIQQLRNPASTETQTAARMLNTGNLNDIPTLINARVNYNAVNFLRNGDDVHNIERNERMFARTVSGLNEDLWVAFVLQIHHEEQDASRAAESAPEPPPHREVPIKSNVYGKSPPDKVKALLNYVLTNIFSVKNKYCEWLIQQVVARPPNFTETQLNEIYGTDATALLPVSVLLRKFNQAYPKLNSSVAFDYACMAYLECDIEYKNQVENVITTSSPELNEFVEQFNTEQMEVYRMWKRFFMIAQLMSDWAQMKHFDRSEDPFSSGGKSRKRSKRSDSKCSKRSKRSNSKRSKRSNSKRSKRSNCRSTRR